MQPPSRLRIVLDTNLVLQDIWYSSRKDSKTALQDALQKSECWVFMAEPIFQEVEEKLIELHRGDVDKQIILWRTVYAPHIWSVRLNENAYHDDPFIQAMCDFDDVPTAQLYLFLLPEFLFSEDKHLKDFSASRELGQVSAAYRDIVDVRYGISAVSVLPIVGISASSEIWGAFRQLPPIVQMVLGGAAVGAFLFFRASLFRKVSDTLSNPDTLVMLEALGSRLEKKLDQFYEASKYIQERLLPAPSPVPVLDHIIEILTVIDEPLSLDDIFQYMLARGYQPKGTNANSKQYVSSVLKRHAILSGYSWQLNG